MSNFKVDPPIVVFFTCKVVFYDELFGNVSDFDVDVLGVYHWHVKVDVFYVNGGELYSFAQDDTVKYEFDEL
jgi:hypothetical protein